MLVSISYGRIEFAAGVLFGERDIPTEPSPRGAQTTADREGMPGRQGTIATASKTPSELAFETESFVTTQLSSRVKTALTLTVHISASRPMTFTTHFDEDKKGILYHASVNN